MKLNKKRVWRTFLQSFFGSLSMNIASIFLVEDTKQKIIFAVLSVLGTAITTGVAAAMNVENAEGGENDGEV